MKKNYKRFWSLVCLFLVVLACTKDVGLITEVEFQLLEQHTADGFVNQGLPTTFTIVPEEELEGYEYVISYEVLEGAGYFEDVDGNRLEAGKGLSIPPLTTSLLYMGTETGEHRVKIVGSDNFGMSEEIEILYNLKNVPARWQANSPVTQIQLGKSADISLLFEIVNTTLNVSYEAKYEFGSGSGAIVPSVGNDYTIGNSFSSIAPSTYQYGFTPEEVGEHQIVFVLQDSNGQELRTDILFNVVEFIQVISINLGEEDSMELVLGDEVEPAITFDPPNATDQGITLVSSDPDVVLIDGNNVCIAVGLGTATVTVTSTSNPDASDSVLVTVIAPDRIPVTAITVAQQDPSADGATRQLVANVLPTDATDPSVIWSSDNTDIATVDENGLLAGLTSGSVTITATSVSDPDISGIIIVEITGGALQSGTDILAFELPGQVGSVIDPETHTVEVTMGDGADLSVIPRLVTASQGAEISPDPTLIGYFNVPVFYTITAENGDEQRWTINTTVLPPTESRANDILTFVLPGQNSSTIDVDNHIVSVNVPDGTPLNVAPQALTISQGASINPEVLAIQNFNAVVIYTITSENGTEQEWTVNVTVSPPTGSGENDITAFELPVQNSTDIDNTNHTITVNVADGTVLNVIPSVFNISPNATIDPAINAIQDFNGPVLYTVTAQNGSPQVWTVNVTVAANRPPVAVDDVAGVELGQSVTINVIDNDSDPDTPRSELVISGVIGVQPENAGSFNVVGQQMVFTSSGDYLGEATFGYTINDGNVGNDDSALVTVTISQTPILVTGISLTPSDLALDVGDRQTLSLTISPANATNQSVTWSSSDDTVATVSQSGEVVAIAPGGATVSAVSLDGSNVTGTANITVLEPEVLVNSITVAPTGTIIKVDETLQLTETVLPMNAANRTVTWSSSNDNIATVDGNGLVTGVGVGTINIIATANDGSGVSGMASITVETAASSAKSIDSFTINGVPGVISGTNIGLTLPANTDVTSLSPIITFTGQSIDPASGVPTDFTGTVTYSVTAEDSSTIDYSVTVNVDSPTNNSPVAQDDLFTVAENGILIRGVFNDNGNGPDSDQDLDPLTVDLVNNNMLNVGNPVNGSQGGQFTIDAGGNLTFDTNGNFDLLNDGESVRTEVTYRITDGNNGFSNTANVTVTVTGVDDPNTDPVADAGLDQTITLPTSTVNLNGSGSSDTPPGTIVSYQWTQVPTGGPTASIVNPNNVSTSINGLTQGSYTFRLTVTDDQNATDTDDVTITVNAQPNTDPVADAGLDQTITLPTNMVNLNGSGSSDAPPGTIVSYQWAQVPTGGPTASIANPNNVSTSINGLTQGSYTFRLTVTDDQNATDTDDVTITVNAQPNTDPVADAGLDQTITLPTNMVNLNGSGSSDAPPGTIVSYQWAQVPTGGPTANIANPSNVSTSINGLTQGSYTFRLTVTDNQNATDTDDVIITVNAQPNTDPVADAGPDQTITLPTSTVNLNGSGSSDAPPGTIVSYQWTQVPTGGPTANIANPSNVSTSINGLTQGSYTFRLTVTDNQNATDTDDVIITVNAQPNTDPVADAGPDQTITLPTNTVNLNGSGSSDTPPGTIVSYLWTSFPATTIVSPNSVATQVTGLTIGSYQFTLEVTDNDGAMASDNVIITVVSDPRSSENDILQFTLSPISGDAVLNTTNHTATTQVPFNTDLTVAPTNLVVSPSAMVSPPRDQEQNFAGAIDYTVTAENGTPQSWRVVVNAAPQAVINPAPHTPDATERRFSGANSTDPNGDNLTYEWVFRDNFGVIIGTYSGTPAIFDFGSEGRYDVQLTVDDGRGGQDTTSTSIVIEAAEPTAIFSNGTRVDPGEPFISGTLTISNGPVAFRIYAFGGSGNIEFESQVNFVIEGENQWIAFASGDESSSRDTPLIPPGTYMYSLEGVFIGSNGNRGSVSPIIN